MTVPGSSARLRPSRTKAGHLKHDSWDASSQHRCRHLESSLHWSSLHYFV